MVRKKQTPHVEIIHTYRLGPRSKGDDDRPKKEIEIWPEDWRESFPKGRKMAFIDDPDGYEIELLED